jgi:glycosyltransferase involved in cell wall biosynthesis
VKIEVYTICHNEEKILPYFLRHYTRFADVTIYDNFSTDRSREIAASFGVRVIDFDSNNQLRDDLLVEIKDNCWKGSRADWVIVVDTDEFVYHKDLPRTLQTTWATVISPKLYNMFSEVFPTTSGQIFEEVTMGIEGGAKLNLFRPGEITSINYSPGCHQADPKGNVIFEDIPGILTLHMKNLSRQYVIDRNAYLSPRLSDINKRKGWGYHLKFGSAEINTAFDNTMGKLIKIL